MQVWERLHERAQLTPVDLVRRWVYLLLQPRLLCRLKSWVLLMTMLTVILLLQVFH